MYTWVLLLLIFLINFSEISLPTYETGDVELKNMQLKPEALNALKLPVKVKAGFLGSVKLQVGGRSTVFSRNIEI